MENNEIIDKLILEGGIEVSGVDSETGEFLYTFTPKLKEIAPSLYKEHVSHVNGEIMRLWESGFINIDLLSDNPIVTLTNKAFNEDDLKALSKDDRWAIAEIKRMLLNKEV